VTFDVDRYRRERNRRLRAQVDHLERHRAQLERLLGLALLVATHGTPCSPMGLLAMLEELDCETQVAA
jgi:hypothetical protein